MDEEMSGIHTRHMKMFFCLLTAVFGFYGLYGVLRTMQRLLSGAGLLPVPLVMSVLALLLAEVCLRKARGIARDLK